MKTTTFMLAFMLLSPLTSVASTPHSPVAATCTGLTGETGDFDLSLEWDGYVRTYHVHVPASYDSTLGTPLVINFHGWGGNGLQQDSYTGMSAKADEEGFIAIHPDGYGNSWNAGGCCGEAVGAGIDDVGFVRAMISAVMDDYCIDDTRIYATGFSNGAMMSHRLACEASDVFAAVAPASGYLALETCTPGRPIPLIQSQGTQDLLVPYEYSLESNDWWAAQNQCKDTAIVYRRLATTCTVHTGCANNATVEWCEVKGMTHAWPTSETRRYGMDATDMFWSFFEQHPYGN